MNLAGGWIVSARPVKRRVGCFDPAQLRRRLGWSSPARGDVPHPNYAVAEGFRNDLPAVAEAG
jgi:hypothetical protein